MVLYIYQNLLNFTAQKMNLKFCKLFKSHLGNLVITGWKAVVTKQSNYKQPPWKGWGKGDNKSNFGNEWNIKVRVKEIVDEHCNLI